MTWKTAYRSIYYATAPEPETPALRPAETALLVIDVQNTCLERPDRAKLPVSDQAQYDLCAPFHNRMARQVIPGTAALLAKARARRRRD